MYWMVVRECDLKLHDTTEMLGTNAKPKQPIKIELRYKEYSLIFVSLYTFAEIVQ